MYREVQELLFSYLNGLDSSFRVYRNEAPQGAPFPYVIYNVVTTEFGEQQPIAIRIYDQNNSYQRITDVVDKIGENLPINLQSEHGIVTLYKGSPFAQDLEEEGVDGSYVNFIIETDFTK